MTSYTPNAPYTLIKSGYVKHKLCGTHTHFRIRLRGDTQWDDDGEGWLFPLRCQTCNKLGGKNDYEFTETESAQ